MRSPQREYQIARAVWLYQRLLLATKPVKRAALGRRIVGWLDRCHLDDRAEYYARITEIYEAMARPDREAQRAALSRSAGRKILDSLTDDEKRTPCGRTRPLAEGDHDDD